MAAINQVGLTPEQQGKVGPFVLGVNNRLADNAMTLDMLRDAVNVVLGDTGKLTRRQGYLSVHTSTATTHSGFGYSGGVLFVEGTDLKRFDPDNNTFTVIRSGLTMGAAMAFVEVNGEIYYSNGVVTGKIVNNVNHDWGILPPSGMMSLAATTGALYAGRYQFALTYLTATGMESGSGTVSSIDIIDNQGILITGIAVSPAADVTSKALYATMQNGDEFYLIAILPVGTTSFNFLSAGYLGAQISTMFKTVPPPGNVLAYSHGRIFSAYKQVITYTDPLAYSQYTPSRNYIWLPDDVQVMCGVSDGLYVATKERTYFFAGGDPAKYELVPMMPYGGAFGSAARIADADDTWCWRGDRGLIVASKGGQVKAVQEDMLSLDSASAGASLFLEQNGAKQIVSLSTPRGYNTSAAAGSFIDMEVRRLGA